MSTKPDQWPWALLSAATAGAFSQSSAAASSTAQDRPTTSAAE
jgi:hypothetical protein